jgi:protein-tyrosine phosphatase
MAEGILASKLKQAGVEAQVDSCGFESFHVGDQPDPRAIQVSGKYGVDITTHRSRLFEIKDFDRFDLIYVMDSGHYRNVVRRARTESDRKKVRYVLDLIYPDQRREVMDPWYHDLQAFELVYQQLNNACIRLVELIQNSNQHDIE